MDNPFDQFDSGAPKFTPPPLGGAQAPAADSAAAPAITRPPDTKPNPFDQFDKPDPGYVGEAARGIKAGFKVQLPEMAGKAAKFFGADKVGDKLLDIAKQNNTEDVQESAVGRANDSPYSVRGNVYEASTNAVPSIAPGAAGAAIGAGVGSIVPGVGTGLGALLGYAAGSIASLPMFYGSQAQDSYEAVKAQQLKLGKTDAEADAIARRTGHAEGAIEAGGEVAADLIPFAKMFKPFVKPAAKVGGTLIKDALFPTLKQGVKTVAQVEAGEVGTEMAQQAGEDQVRKSVGGTGPGATWDETSKVILPTALMSIVPGAAGAAGSHIQRKAAIATLADPESDPDKRSDIAVGLAAAIEPVDSKLSRAFSQYAAEKIQAKQPIEIGDDQMYLNKPDAPLQLEHQAGPPLINFPDGTTMTAAEAKQRGLYQQVPAGPMTQAAETARAAGAGSTGPFFPYTQEGAEKRATFLTNQGEPHRVAPHHSREGRFMAIPDTLSGTTDKDRIKALEDEGKILIEHSNPDARQLLPQVRTRLADIDAEVESIKGDIAARAEKKKQAQEVETKRKTDEEALAAETEKKKQAEVDKLARESKLPAALHDAEVADTVAEKSGALDALEQPNAMQLALRTALKRKERLPSGDSAAPLSGNDDVMSGQVVVNGAARNAQRVGDLLNVETLRSKGLNGVDIPRQRMVLRAMVAGAHDPKILDSVIGPDVVAMVNVLSGKKFTSDMLRNNPSVLKDVLAASENNDISGAANKPEFRGLLRKIRSVASAITELPLAGSSVSGASNATAAPSARNNTSAVSDGTRSRTKNLVANLRRSSGDLSPASGAGGLNGSGPKGSATDFATKKTGRLPAQKLDTALPANLLQDGIRSDVSGDSTGIDKTGSVVGQNKEAKARPEEITPAETPAKAGVSTSGPELTASQIPADVTITLPVKDEESGETHDVDFNAREIFRESNRRLKRLQALRDCLR